MENEKTKKGSVGTIICILIIIALIAGLIGMYFYFNNKVNEAEKATEKYASKLEEAIGSDKKSITAEEFKEYIKKIEDFEIYNPQEGNLSAEFLHSLKDGYISQTNNDDGLRINFFEFKDENFAKFYHYEVITANDDLIKHQASTEESLNFNRYTMITQDYYISSSRIGNTILYGIIKAEDQAKLDEIINDLGY